MKHLLSAIAIFLAGFGIAWWVKPDAASAGIAFQVATTTDAHRTSRSPDDYQVRDGRFFQCLKEAGYQTDKHQAVLHDAAPAEIPVLLAELQARGGMGGLDYNGSASSFK